jgi:hypothetical protein
MAKVPTRYPQGVTDSSADANTPFRMLPILFPGKLHTYFNDFDTYNSGDWTITAIDGGTAAAQVIALADENGGVLSITNNAADDDQESFQKKGESFKFISGKQLWFAARLAISDATQSDLLIGLAITDTTPLDASDGVFWRKDDGDANLDFVVVKNSTATTATAAATATTGYVELAFYYNGKDGIEYFKDGVKLGTSVLTNMPDDEELTVSFSIKNGEAVAKVLKVDWIFVAEER